MQRHVVLGNIVESFDDVDLAVSAISITDGPAIVGKLDLWSIEVCMCMEAYNDGQVPQSLPGMCAKSPMRRP